MICTGWDVGAPMQNLQRRKKERARKQLSAQLDLEAGSIYLYVFL